MIKTRGSRFSSGAVIERCNDRRSREDRGSRCREDGRVDSRIELH